LPQFGEGQVPFWSYFLLIQNFIMARTGDWGAAPLGVTWSVALEEQFYLFLPLWIRFVPVRWLPLSFLGLAALGPVFRAIAPLEHAPFLVPGSGEALFFGTWLAWAFQNKPEIFRHAAWRKSVLGVLALSAAGMVLLVTKRDLGVFSITVITSFWAAFLWLVLGYMGTAWTAPLRNAGLRFVGGVSYAVYLFHLLVNLLIFIALTGAPARHELGLFKGFCIATLSFVCTLALARISFYGMESRLIAFGRRFKYRRETAADAPIAVAEVRSQL
jgi:peptidoglycan/LPS O-acetylase OafA/YrhL